MNFRESLEDNGELVSFYRHRNSASDLLHDFFSFSSREQTCNCLTVYFVTFYRLWLFPRSLLIEIKKRQFERGFSLANSEMGTEKAITPKSAAIAKERVTGSINL